MSLNAELKEAQELGGVNRAVIAVTAVAVDERDDGEEPRGNAMHPARQSPCACVALLRDGLVESRQSCVALSLLTKVAFRVRVCVALLLIIHDFRARLCHFHPATSLFSVALQEGLDWSACSHHVTHFLTLTILSV